MQPPNMGPVVAISQVGGLHHRYDMRAHARLLTIDSPKLVHEHKQSSQGVAGPESCRAVACTRSRMKFPSATINGG
jgi:hypothetical protein